MDFRVPWKKFRYSFLHGYDIRRWRKVFAVFFGVIGFIWTFIECYSWIFEASDLPDKIRAAIREYLLLELSLLFCLSLIQNRRKLSVRKSFANTNLSIIVEFCDIFEQKGAVVIPVSDTFDSDISNGLVNPGTIHGQFIRKYYENNHSALDHEIDRVLGRCGKIPIVDTTLPGKKNRYGIGSTAAIRTGEKYFYLTALTAMRNTGNVEMQPQYINDFLSGLWSFIPLHGEYHDVVNVPVIGTGLNRLPANYTNGYILKEIVHSFFIASKQQTFCKTLKVCLHPQSYSLYDFEKIDVLLCHIDAYVNR